MQAKPSMVSGNNAEFDFLKIPDYDRYLDLNVGNGDLLFTLRPKKTCYINDINKNLIEFYKNLTNNQLITELEKLANAWSLIKDFSFFSADEIYITFHDLLKEIITLEDAEYIIRAVILMNTDNAKFSALFNQDFLVNIDLFTNSIIKSIIRELKKLKGSPEPINTSKISDSFRISIETAFKYGFFNHFQNILNLQNTEFVNCINNPKRLSLWYFLSQTCKGRFSYAEKKSSTNKYGGEQNNSIDFKLKVDHFKSDNFKELISKCTFSSESFSDFINKMVPGKKDLICGDYRVSNYFSPNSKDVLLKNEISQTVEMLSYSKSYWIILLSSEKLIDPISNNESLNIETTEIQGKTTILLKNF